MSEGSIIRVLDGATLTLDGIIVKPCSNMWESIIVESGGALVANNVTFTGGHRAITAEGGSNISITNCQFIDNAFGVYVPEPPGTNVFALNFVNVEEFYGNVFEGTGSLPPPHSGITSTFGNLPQAGIRIHSAVGFEVLGAAGLGVTAFNRFRNMLNGILSYKSSLIVSRAIFEDLEQYGIRCSAKDFFVVNSLNCTGIGSGNDDDPTFNNIGRAAISTVRTNGDIKECFITNVPRGIEVIASKNLNYTIEDNNIQAGINGIYTSLCTPLNGSIYNNFFTVSTLGDDNSTQAKITAISCYEDNNQDGQGWSRLVN